MQPPPGWGDDELSRFIDTAHRNCWATYANKRDAYQKLAAIDACFMRVGRDWLNPENIVTPLLFFRSHSVYRAACNLAMSGQVVDAFPLLRSCLEYAGYALHIHRNPLLAEIWLRRHDDATTKRRVRDEFTFARVRASVTCSDRKIGEIFEQLYERAIDFGAHPNERAITGGMKIEDVDGGKRYEQIYLHGDGLTLQHVLRTAAQTGLCALGILQDAFKARFELLGVREEILKLRNGL